jgi:hypothetical protein
MLKTQNRAISDIILCCVSQVATPEKPAMAIDMQALPPEHRAAVLQLTSVFEQLTQEEAVRLLLATRW